MSNIRYTEYKKKQRGRYVWGVLRMEGRKQKFRTVGEGEGARRKAKKLAQHLSEMEEVAVSPEDRFLSWHRSGERPPLSTARFAITLELRSTPSRSPGTGPTWDPLESGGRPSSGTLRPRTRST